MMSPDTLHTSSLWSSTSLVLLMLVLQACTVGVDLQRPAPVKQTYLLEMDRAHQVAPDNAPTLRIAPVRVAAGFEGRALVYRMAQGRFEADFYNQWFTSPRDQVFEVASQWFNHGAVFREVVPQNLATQADYRLDLLVTRLYVDMSDPARHAGRVGLQAYLSSRDAEGRSVLMHETLEADRPVSVMAGEVVGDAAARVVALTGALEDVLLELEQRIGEHLAGNPVGGR
ncbi:MAG: ABC-type transport auxiliary lipoprotein family protein [Thioalkalivibrio sp.]